MLFVILFDYYFCLFQLKHIFNMVFKKKDESFSTKKEKIEKELEKQAKNVKKECKKSVKNAKNAMIFVFDKLKKVRIKNLKLCCVNLSINQHGMNIIYVLIGITFLVLLSTGLSFLTAVCLFLLAMSAWFFRDPERVLPERKNVIVAPCDGLPEELNSNDTKEYTKISTFMNITDMHIQRMPVDCKVKQIEYIKGAFISANLDKASKDNERNYVVVEAENGDTICITQIAGFVARRIVCDVKQDEICKAGERYGCIKFGSRIELYVPKSYKIEVLTGQRMVCGETIVASWK